MDLDLSDVAYQSDSLRTECVEKATTEPRHVAVRQRLAHASQVFRNLVIHHREVQLPRIVANGEEEHGDL
jgi:hypothetical protein